MRSIIRWMILVSICLGGWGLASLPAYAVQSAETRVIRIGYTEHPGFIELAKDGKYRGLGVDYPEFATKKSSEASQHMGFHCFFA